MPAYNFQKRFVPLILDGRKPHTIRKRRKRPTKVGDTLYLFTGLRTKQAVRFAEAVCIAVEPVRIYPFEKRFEMWTDVGNLYYEMSPTFLNALALHDGFNYLDDFFEFFRKTYRQDVLDDFEIIWWNHNELKEVK